MLIFTVVKFLTKIPLYYIPSRRRCSVGLERRASDCKVAGSMPVLGITSLCPWERHLTLISKQALCVVWKDSTGVCFTTAYIPEKT